MRKLQRLFAALIVTSAFGLAGFGAVGMSHAFNHSSHSMVKAAAGDWTGDEGN